MIAELIVKNVDGNVISESRVMSFTFRKEAYMPYTLLNAHACMDISSFANAAEIMFYIDGRLVHHGLVDSLSVTHKGGKNIAAVSSRSFTSLLCQNQIEPGFKENVTIGGLVRGYYVFPNVTYQDIPESGNYIYVNNNSSVWDSVVNLSYRLYGSYPYIRETNKIMISAEERPSEFVYTADEVLTEGSAITSKRLISDFHMSNIAGNYGEFELTDWDVRNERIIRHKYFELDMEFLRDPIKALEYRDKYAARGWKRRFFSYSGYKGEDLSDKVGYGDIQSQRISAIEIKGSSKGIITEISVYNDKFNG